ncbi:hypothetical protein P26059A_0008 [Curvibacter phage P26059A]|nr:hypothetical protein P26059A_0008 [Curvibacter phage P26059A]
MQIHPIKQQMTYVMLSVSQVDLDMVITEYTDREHMVGFG